VVLEDGAASVIGGQVEGRGAILLAPIQIEQKQKGISIKGDNSINT
jgi:hypothetical protein